MKYWGGIAFSSLKTKCMHFSRKYTLHIDPILQVGDDMLPFVTTVKFFGLIFDRSLTWKHHIYSLWTRCSFPLNILCILHGTFWVANRKLLLELCHALIRSVLDYGSIVYGSASLSTLQSLNTIHHDGIHLSTGAFHISRINCLLLDSGEPSVSNFQDILLGSCGFKISGLPMHPTYKSLLHPQLNCPSLSHSTSILVYILYAPVQYPYTRVPPSKF